MRSVDVVFDTVGGDTQERAFQTLKRGGVLVSTVSPPSAEKAKQFGVTVAMVADDAKARSARGDRSFTGAREIERARGNGVAARGSKEGTSTLGLRTRRWEDHFAALIEMSGLTQLPLQHFAVDTTATTEGLHDRDLLTPYPGKDLCRLRR